MKQSRLSRRPPFAAPLPSLAGCVLAALASGCAGEAASPAVALHADDSGGDGGGDSAAAGAAADVLDSQVAGPEATDAEPNPPAADASQSAADSPPSGETTATLDALAATPWGEAQCATGGPKVGFDVGQRLGDLPIQDCDTGDVRSISEVCGAKAAWIFVAHSHCPTCTATADYTSEVAAAVQSKDVAVVHIVHIDTATTCAAWRKKYALEGLSNVHVYADKSGAAWAALKLQNYTAIHAFTDGGQVVRYKAHGLSSAQVTKQIDAALKP